MQFYFLRAFALSLLMVGMWGCDSSDPAPADEQPLPDLSTVEQQIVRTDNGFGLNLLQALHTATPDSNIFISPISVSMALGMTRNGADGATLDAFNVVLEKTGLTETEINAAYRTLIDLLTTLDPKVNLQIANAIWSRQGFAVEADFLETNQATFDAEIDALDFNDPGAVNIINQWVDEKTQGKINKLIEEIGADTVMLLVNAIYFQGTWLYQFDPDETRTAPFYNADGTSSEVPLMYQEATLLYLQTDRFSMIELPYGDSLYSMTVLLPNEGETVTSVIEELTPEAWAQWQAGLTPQKVLIWLPRFELAYKTSLKAALSAMGMDVAFTPGEADFSRINPNVELYISDVLHKTVVEVNEEGTEAAAVTGVIVDVTSLGPVMRVDRPFIFMIRERHTGTLLFIGQAMSL